MTDEPVKKAACAIFHPLGWEDADTAATKAEVKEHNAVWRKTCGGQP